jgi:hypothetical protein
MTGLRAELGGASGHDEVVPLVERFGRIDWHELDPGVRAEAQAALVERFRPLAEADAGALLELLATTCVPAGGWAAYGADRLMVRLFGVCSEHLLSTPGGCILDASAAFLRNSGVPWRWVPLYLRQRLTATGYCGPECSDNCDCPHWIPCAEVPGPGDVAIRSLVDGEQRCVAVCGPQATTRVVVQNHGHQVATYLDLSCNPDGTIGSTRVGQLICWQVADELDELYLDIGQAFLCRSWTHPELAPYCVRPEPRI